MPCLFGLEERWNVRVSGCHPDIIANWSENYTEHYREIQEVCGITINILREDNIYIYDIDACAADTLAKNMYSGVTC